MKKCPGLAVKLEFSQPFNSTKGTPYRQRVVEIGRMKSSFQKCSDFGQFPLGKGWWATLENGALVDFFALLPPKRPISLSYTWR